jgi:hypothetical protein
MTALATTKRGSSSSSSSPSPACAADTRASIRAMCQEYADSARHDPQATLAPIRAMARMVSALQVVREVISNRTIGDVNPRLIVEHDARYDYRSLADDLGIAFPQENINGYVSSGETYLALRARMRDQEEALFARGWDLHMYDLAGVGNPTLRQWIAWGLSFAPDQIFLSTGSLDGLDKSLRGLRATRWDGPANAATLLFPTPSFDVPEWQARSLGVNVVRVPAQPEHHYKLTPDELLDALRRHPEARGIYLLLLA